MSLIELTIVAIIVAAAVSSIMAGAWYLQQRTGNSGWVDVTWSLAVGGIAAIAAVWRRAQELLWSIGHARDRHSPITTVRDAPERPWYDDPGAARGL